MLDQQNSWPDWKYPLWRGLGPQLTPERWLQGRREDDGAEGLWRIHDGLYELSLWIQSHPGGSEWLEITKGTDITEAFETHHLGPLAYKMLVNFYVRPAKCPRNSPFTFKADGFYAILKSRVYKKIKHIKPGPSSHSKRAVEFLALGTIIFSVLAARYKSFILGTLGGIFLALNSSCAHNFFHMRDNWRMYLFNLSLFVVRQWRISHSLSHHLFPNTHMDLEISMFEPIMMYLPNDKSKLYGVLSAIYSPLVYPFIFIGAAASRVLLTRPQMQDLIGLLLPTLMVVFSPLPLWDALVLWLYSNMVGSFFFGLIGLNAAHHHPEIFHYGDMARQDRDWGLLAMDTTRDRVEFYGAPNLVLVTFGDHTLHHLFPTIDHVYLHGLYPTLENTCKEFGIEFKLTTVWNLLFGQFRQLMRNTPNLKEPH